MSGQTAYVNQSKGFSGQRVGLGHKAKTYQNDVGSTKQIVEFTVTAAVNSTPYTFSVNGTPVTYTSDATATLAEIRDGLCAAFRAIQALESVASANPSGAATFRLTAKTPGVGYTATEADANLTVATIQANVATQSIKFGRAVVKRTGGNSNDASAMLPSATGQAFLGVAERIHTNVDPSGAIAQDAISPMQDMTVGYSGTWLVEVESAVAPEDPVFFRHTAGAGGSELGIFRNANVVGETDQVSAAKFKSTASAGGVAEVQVNLP